MSDLNMPTKNIAYTQYLVVFHFLLFILLNSYLYLYLVFFPYRFVILRCFFFFLNLPNYNVSLSFFYFKELWYSEGVVKCYLI